MPPTPPPGSPNVIVVVLDDVGFAQFECFGSDIATPTLNALADRGLRYRRFHTTAMCSPTRAALLTGRNPHTVGIGGITELASGFPGYNGRLNPACAFVPRVLRDAGWATFAVGKWHLCPAEEQHNGARRVRWPLGVGFERFFGFLGPETSQWAPDLVIDNTVLSPVESDIHLTTQLIDRTICMIDDLRNCDGTKPFFTYLALGACHAPHHAPAEFIDRYQGHFDKGWDAWREATHARQIEAGIIPPTTTLSERPSWVPAWDSLSAEDRRVAARLMEAFAGFLTHTDAELGRLIDHLERTGDMDNTVIMVMSDNGASAEGGVTGTFNGAYLYNGMPHDAVETAARAPEIGGKNSFPNYPWGWAFAGNTPFRRWKRETHEGGIGDPLIVVAPEVTDPGAVRNQYVHAVDIGATVLDLCGLEMPPTVDGIEQLPLAGSTIAASFTDAHADGRNTQYYEQFGCRAMYHEGWKAVAFHPLFPYEPGDDPWRPFDQDRWELYNVDEDPSECNDLAAAEPERLAMLQDMWWAQAGQHGALPLQGFRGAIGARLPKNQRIELRPFASGVPESTAPDTKMADHHLLVELEVGPEPLHGVLIAQGGRFGGYSLYAHNGVLAYTYNFFGTDYTDVVASTSVDRGPHTITVECTNAGFAMDVTLRVDESVVATGHVPRLVPLRFSLAGENLCCGFDDATPVSPSYAAPFRCNAAITRAVVDATGATEPTEADIARKEIQIQ